MPSTREAGLRGRLPKKPPAERFNIQYLSAYLTSPLPAPTYPVDVTAGVRLGVDTDNVHTLTFVVYADNEYDD